MAVNPYEPPRALGDGREAAPRRLRLRPFEIGVCCLLAAIVVAAIIDRRQHEAGSHSLTLTYFQLYGFLGSLLGIAPVCVIRALLFLVNGQRMPAIVNLLLPLIVVVALFAAMKINPGAFIR